MIERIKESFQKHFATKPLIIQSPGRVNLIGEHTDYNEGFVLPAAIDKSITLAMAPNQSNKLRFVSVDKQETVETIISDSFQKSDKGWPNYLLGVLDELQKDGFSFSGFDCVFGGNVPIGAGLSSSAALEGGVLFGVKELHNWDIPPVKMAEIAQRAENNFVGVRCGIMDQFASLNGKENHAIKLDCRSLDYEYIPFEHQNVRLLLCDTKVRRELASSEYNVRREQCEQGVQVLKQFNPKITSLRDVSMPLLLEHKDELSPVVFKRCQFVLEENKRVLNSCSDLKNKDLESFGERMYQSHDGLQNKYEVSCEELDVLVQLAQNAPGVYGARMMGGGFGGCTLNLVEEEHTEDFIRFIKEGYRRHFDTDIEIYQTQISQGTHAIS